MFPGYVLVKMEMTDDSWYVVRNTRGVTGFVGPAPSRSPSPPGEVDALGVEKRSSKVDYAVGDNVRSPRARWRASPEWWRRSTRKNNTVQVKVSMFGRETSAELELSKVKAGLVTAISSQKTSFCGF